MTLVLRNKSDRRIFSFLFCYIWAGFILIHSPSVVVHLSWPRMSACHVVALRQIVGSFVVPMAKALLGSSSIVHPIAINEKQDI